jgi:hypothetical protein
VESSGSKPTRATLEEEKRNIAGRLQALRKAGFHEIFPGHFFRGKALFRLQPNTPPAVFRMECDRITSVTRADRAIRFYQTNREANFRSYHTVTGRSGCAFGGASWLEGRNFLPLGMQCRRSGFQEKSSGWFVGAFPSTYGSDAFEIIVHVNGTGGAVAYVGPMSWIPKDSAFTGFFERDGQVLLSFLTPDMQIHVPTESGNCERISLGPPLRAFPVPTHQHTFHQQGNLAAIRSHPALAALQPAEGNRTSGAALDLLANLFLKIANEVSLDDQMSPSREHLYLRGTSQDQRWLATMHPTTDGDTMNLKIIVENYQRTDAEDPPRLFLRMDGESGRLVGVATDDQLDRSERAEDHVRLRGFIETWAQSVLNDFWTDGRLLDVTREF